MKYRYDVMQHFTSFTLLLILLTASTQANSDSLFNADQRIDIEYISPLDSTKRKQLQLWLQDVSDALLTVYGAWPKDRFNITVKHGAGSGSPVPWGQVNRGNPDNVLLVINPGSAMQEIMADWTAYHEVSHLLIPYSGTGDGWLSEGLATYYQNIIQARAGVLSETELWNKLASGFERGRSEKQWSQKNLTEISDNMGKYRSFMRVHWSGVHYWLTADTTLRQQSNNQVSLDHLLEQLKTCCQHKSMSAIAIVEQLDQLAGTNLFKPLFLEYRASHAMPDYQPILSRLGVIFQPQANKSDVVLTTSAPAAEIRTSIYKGDGR
jgi:hypothetical protein